MFLQTMLGVFLSNLKKISGIKPCFEKIFKERKPKFIWSDKESSFFSNEIIKFFKTTTSKFIILIQS